MTSDEDDLRTAWGLPPCPAFLDGPPPRPVNLDQIRALHTGTLPMEEAEEIEDLIVAFREWSEADRQVLKEIVRSRQPIPNSSLDESAPLPPGAAVAEAPPASDVVLSDEIRLHSTRLSTHSAETGDQRRWTKLAAWSSTVAALLFFGSLIGLTWYLGSARLETLTVDVSIEGVRTLNGQSPRTILPDSENVLRIPSAGFELRIAAPRDGAAMIVVIANHSVQLYPKAGETPIVMKKQADVTYGPISAPEGQADLLLVVSEERAINSLRQAFVATEPITRGDAELISRIRQMLGKSGAHWMAFERLVIDREQPPPSRQ